MKYILSAIFTIGVLAGISQEIKKTSKVVLIKDSIQVFDKKYASLQFGESYFVCKEEYNYPFTDAGFDALVDDLKAQAPDIAAFKSADRKAVICIFPKLSTKGIRELHDFISAHFPDKTMAQVKKQQTIHVQVVQNYDPLDPESEKGFSYN
jgi:hypothetical protein